MRFNIRSIFKRKEQDFSYSERQLEIALQPVAPRDEFVRELRRKLARQWTAPQQMVSSDTRSILLLIGAGFLSGLLLLVLSIRVVVTIIASLGLLYQFKRQIDEKKTTQLPPAI